MSSAIALASVEVSATLAPHTRCEIGSPSAVCTTLSRHWRVMMPSLARPKRRKSPACSDKPSARRVVKS